MLRACVLGTVGMGLLVVAGIAGIPKRLWAETSLHLELQPPCPTAVLNPLALKGSGTGKTLSFYLLEGADSAEHMGMADEDDAPNAVTPVGALIERLERSRMPAEHVHEHDHDEGQGHGHEDEETERRERERIHAFAQKRMEADEKWAYLLDPTNFDALETYAGWVRGASKELVEVDDGNGWKRLIPLGSLRVIQLCQFALKRFNLDSGRWPEHCLYAAQTRITIWNEKFTRDRFDDETGADRETRLRALSQLAGDVEALLHRARRQQEALAGSGQWDVRPQSNREAFERRYRETEAFLKIAGIRLNQRRE